MSSTSLVELVIFGILGKCDGQFSLFCRQFVHQTLLTINWRADRTEEYRTSSLIISSTVKWKITGCSLGVCACSSGRPCCLLHPVRRWIFPLSALEWLRTQCKLFSARTAQHDRSSTQSVDVCFELDAQGGIWRFLLFYSLIVLLLYPQHCFGERFTVTWLPHQLGCC